MFVTIPIELELACISSIYLIGMFLSKRIFFNNASLIAFPILLSALSIVTEWNFNIDFLLSMS